MSVYLRKRRTLTEEDTQNQQTTNTQTTKITNNIGASQKVQEYNEEIVKCQNAINIAEQRYQEEKKKQNANILQLQQKIVQLSGTPVEVAVHNESTNVNFSLSKKLYESVQLGKTDELAAAVGETFNNLPELSYYMDEKGCVTLAKRMLTFLNDQSWNDGENHWNEVSEFLTNTLSKANISLSSREMGEFISTFAEVLKTKSMFSWIFGRQNIAAAQSTAEDIDAPIEDEIIPEEETYPYPVRPGRRLYNRNF